MDRQYEQLIRELSFRSTGDETAVRFEQFGERMCLESDSFLEYPLGSDWLFQSATEDEAEVLLQPFIAGGLEIGPGLSCEMSRLLAEKGYVVKKQLRRIFESTDWSLYATPSHILSGLHYLPNWTVHVERLLQIVPEDWRDGLFLSIWVKGGRDAETLLLERFEDWILIPDWGSASGERGWLGKFIAKWLFEKTFDCQRLGRILTWYFIQVVLPR